MGTCKIGRELSALYQHTEDCDTRHVRNVGQVKTTREHTVQKCKIMLSYLSERRKILKRSSRCALFKEADVLLEFTASQIKSLCWAFFSLKDM